MASFALFGTFLEKYGKKYFRKEILSGETVLILLFFLFGHFSTLGGNKSERLNLKKSSSFRELRGNILKVKLCHIFLCNKIVFWWMYLNLMAMMQRSLLSGDLHDKGGCSVRSFFWRGWMQLNASGVCYIWIIESAVWRQNRICVSDNTKDAWPAVQWTDSAA